MRMLLPTPAILDDAGLAAAYAWPAAGRWLRANMVSTVDGAARSPDGLSHAISSDTDRRVFGRLRVTADVVLVGASTVREELYRPIRPRAADVAVRRELGQPPAPQVAVVTRSLALDLTSALFQEPVVRTLVVTCASAPSDARARVAEVADVVVCGDDDVDLAAAVSALTDRGHERIHSEGGPHLLAGLAAAGVLDELLLTVSPLLAGGGYEDRSDVTRILAGRVLPGAPRQLRLAHVLEDEGTLFLRYLVERAG